MLIAAKKIADFRFSELMEVYREGNLENGEDLWPEEPRDRQLALAEQEFYNYLQQVFFATEGAIYLIWQEAGRYVSALRLEPYQDGLLLEALETAPDQRRKGYARELICAALEQTADSKVYSHISKRNTASLRTHESCGFRKILDHAVYADGSVLQNSCTYCYNPEK